MQNEKSLARLGFERGSESTECAALTAELEHGVHLVCFSLLIEIMQLVYILK